MHIDQRKGFTKKGEIIVHPKSLGDSYYSQFGLSRNGGEGSGWSANDIAIIKLPKGIIFNEFSDSNLFLNSDKISKRNQAIGTYVRPICLPNPVNGIKPKTTNKVIVTGYGIEESGKTCCKLKGKHRKSCKAVIDSFSTQSNVL